MSLINPMANAHLISPPPSMLQIREAKEQSLRREQVVQATVAEGGLSKVLLEIGGKQTWVETELPLRTGQKLNLEVVETAHGLELRPVSGSLIDKVIRSLHLLGEKFDLLPLLTQLADPRRYANNELLPRTRSSIGALLSLWSGEQSEQDAALLKNLNRILGLDFETQLLTGNSTTAMSSLKGILFDLENLYRGKEGPLHDQLAHLGSILEAHQYCRAKLSQDGLIFIPLPLPFLEAGYLIGERHHSKTEHSNETQAHRLSINLKLPTLGWVKVDLLWQPDEMLARVECDRPETLAKFTQVRDDWQQLLTPFGLTNLSIVATQEDPATELARKVMNASSSVLNARI